MRSCFQNWSEIESNWIDSKWFIVFLSAPQFELPVWCIYTLAGMTAFVKHRSSFYRSDKPSNTSLCINFYDFLVASIGFVYSVDWLGKIPLNLHFLSYSFATIIQKQGCNADAFSHLHFFQLQNATDTNLIQRISYNFILIFWFPFVNYVVYLMTSRWEQSINNYLLQRIFDETYEIRSIPLCHLLACTICAILSRHLGMRQSKE